MKNAMGVRSDMDARSYLRYQRLRAKRQVSGAGSPLHVGLADENDFPHQGILDYFNGNFLNGTIEVFGVIPNPDPLLLPGMFARVRMPFGKPRTALELVDDAIFQDGGQGYVWVVNDRNLIERRGVKGGQMDRG